jgi:glycosyltransferase involved in cell wall biosynthesis
MALRIALVITELHVGGAERCLTNLAIGLNRSEFEPVVYSLAPRPHAEHDALVRQLDDAGTPMQFLGVRSSRQFLAAVRRLRRLLAAQRPHVVQSFLYHANIVATLAARIADRPCIAWGLRVADPSRWRQFVERRLQARAAVAVCVSNSVAEFYAGRVGFPRDKLAVIPNGIDVARYAATARADLASLGLTAGRQAIVAIGRLHSQKGLDWLLHLTPRLFSRLPDHDLLLVGEGPERPRLETLARSLGVSDRVHFAGFRPDVPAILRASRLLVLPSRWEGMPNVVLEAMSLGLPVVSSRVQGVEELLGPQADAQIVARENSDGFLAKLCHLAKNPDLASEIGMRNQERATEHYSLTGMIRAYEQIYKSLSASAQH